MRHYTSYGSFKSRSESGYAPSHAVMARWFADRYARCRWLASAAQREARRCKALATVPGIGPAEAKRRESRYFDVSYDMKREAKAMRRLWRVHNLCVLVACKPV